MAVRSTDEHVVRHEHIGQKDLVELQAPAGLLDRRHLDAGRRHVNEEVADATVLLRIGIRARQQRSEVSPVSQRCPDLVSVDQPSPVNFGGAGG
jgi:hypothetical protein